MARAQWRERIEAAAAERVAAARVRSRRSVGHRDGARVEVDGRSLLNFCGNDYLGLSQHYAVVGAMQDAAAREGAGGVASHLVCGHHALHDALEKELADWLGAPRALLFGSGFLANLAVLQALLGDDDVCVQDRLNHASLVDAARLAGCKLRRYPHADAEGALRQLRAQPEGMAMLVTDGVFSMDGDIAPLPGLLALADRFDALLLVDDAHGLGVLGQGGLGCVEHFGLSSPRLVVVGTLGKSAGLAGAFVVATDAVTHHLLQRSRNYIFSTASPPAIEHALLTALDLMSGPEGQRRRRDLTARCEQLRAGLTELLRQHPELPWQLTDSSTPIQPLIVGRNAEAMRLAARLEQAGIRVPGIRPPTVPAGTARLRITLCASHTEADVERLLQVLRDAAAEAQVSQPEGADA